MVTRTPLQQPTKSGARIEADPGSGRVPERGTLGLGDTAWAKAKQRVVVIGPLAAADLVSAAAAGAAGEALGLAERTIYALVRRYRQSGGLLASLAPQASPGGRGKTRLSPAAEQMIAEAIRTEYLTRQKKSAEAVVRAVRQQAKIVGMAPPAPNTVRARVRAVKADLAARRREGARSAAVRRLEPATGMTPPTERPMEVLQIDHTPVDLILVDETHRKPLGRPWLTVAIDVHSRCIAGTLLSFDAPCATSVALCLAHAALPKETYLRHLGIEGFTWPVEGKPGRLHVDNGAEFHSEALRRGCEQHGIEIHYRPVATPHFGGVIERLIGTLMRMVHELPGTTFSNSAERGDYDSDAAACLTLPELERWLALAIVGPYHNDVHEGIDEPPLARWRRGIAASGAAPAVTDPRGFLIDFLPVLRRRVTREGIRVDHIAYYSDVLRPWIVARESSGLFLVRRDPRDLSRVFVLDPKDGAYVEVPCARQERPSITLYEHRQAVARLKAEGLAQVDEAAIFRAVAEQREIARVAAAQKRTARRRLARVQQSLTESRSMLPGTSPAGARSIGGDDDPDTVIAVSKLYSVTRW